MSKRSSPAAARYVPASTNLKRASRSMNRRISHALAIRSTKIPARVTQVRRRCGFQCVRQGAYRLLGHRSTGSVKEVDGSDCGEAPLEPRQIVLRTHTPPVGIPIASAQPSARLAGRDGQLGVVGVARFAKLSDDLLASEAIHEIGRTDRRVAAAFVDLGADPLKILERLRTVRQDVHRFLDRHGAESLQASADFDAQIIWFGGNLMDEDEPWRQDG